MPPSDPSPASLTPIVQLAPVVLGIFLVLLKFALDLVKEAPTPSARAALIRNIISWVSTALWACAIPVVLLDLAPKFTLLFWGPAFLLESYLFLTNSNQKTLRWEIFRVLMGAQSLLFIAILDLLDGYADSLHALTTNFGKLLEVLSGK